MADLPRTPDVDLRSFREADREGLIQLWTICELLRPWNEPNRDIDTEVDRDPEGLLVLVEHDTVIGAVMAGYDGHRGWVNYLAVHPDRRSRGFARKLMAAEAIAGMATLEHDAEGPVSHLGVLRGCASKIIRF
jgi:ribosomal protein S18 acetylase RimI-like enzyme